MQKLKFSIFRLLAMSFMLFAIATTPAAAGKDKIYKTEQSDIAVSGYDVVAYFTAGKPVKGNTAITLTHEGAVWHFSSKENMERFAANPTHYAPQFGGHCSWAASQGYLASGDPEAWKIVDDKLYLNYDQEVKKEWEADQANFITAGHKNWPKLVE